LETSQRGDSGKATTLTMISRMGAGSPQLSMTRQLVDGLRLANR